MDIRYIHRVQVVDKKKWECILHKVVNNGLNDGQVGIDLNNWECGCSSLSVHHSNFAPSVAKLTNKSCYFFRDTLQKAALVHICNLTR